MTKVKICGITSFDDAVAAAEAGADLIGLNFYRPSLRYIDPANAAKLASALRAKLGAACPLMVGVFVNEPPGQLFATADQVGLDYLQLHGDEPPEVLAQLNGRGIKALRPTSVDEAMAQVKRYLPVMSTDEHAPSILLDAYHPILYGGTGETGSIEVALAVREGVPRLMLAGGLTPENIRERVAAIKPWGVDTASGVENGNPRQKDHRLIMAFTHNVYAADSGDI